VGEDYIPCRNLGPAGSFELCPEDLDDAERRGAVRAYCHSHPGSHPSPGALDKEICEETGVPWYIIGANNQLWRHDPSPIPLYGREFIYGWQDCYSLVRDYYGNLPDFPREESFWELKHEPYLDNFAANGFINIDREEAQAGDLVLMKIKSHGISNHAAIYLGVGKILHHMWNTLSREEDWAAYMEFTTCVLRRTT
jgi:cell wall-associated NlpC family hydrolase